MEVFKIIALIIGVLFALTLMIIDLAEWRKDTCDSDSCITVRHKNIFASRLITYLVFLILLLITLGNYLWFSHQLDIWFVPLLPILIIIMTNSTWKITISKEGVKKSGSYRVRWDDVKSYKWLSKNNDTLLIAHRYGYLTIKVKDKKPMVAEFLERKGIRHEQ
jgi:Mn2+/Fe2+ NRAMP family transporter